MSEKSRYLRYYIPLSEEDSGFGINNSPEGLARFEIKDDQCCITITIENLKSPEAGFSYKCYLIAADRDKVTWALIGNIEAVGTKSSLSAGLSYSDVGGTGLDIEKFNLAAISYQPSASPAQNIQFPLAGYKHEKVIWKNSFLSSLTGSKLPDTETKTVQPEHKTKIPESQPPANHTPDYSSKNCEWTNLLENFDYFDISFSPFGTQVGHLPQQHIPCTVEKIRNLENMLSMSFNECKPFTVSENLPKWWKIQNHQLLKRILYSIDCFNLVFTSNFISTSYYIYGYFIVGIDYTDESVSFIYGIPALYGIDPKPGDLPYVWMSENNKGEFYGEFGYWIIRFDIE